MRIRTDEKIVGYPAHQVRQLMREIGCRPVKDTAWKAVAPITD
jgi:hypothetical protein